ncbi:MAG: IclR family transcriptional regulator [Geobacteraceae bacterium]|nr:IclR family transcriptional regulator [Geobacteraceae bacterium]
MKAAADNYMIKTVAKAMDLLDQFRAGEAEFGITDLSKRLNLEKNNVFRLVVTLTAKNYIEINSSTGKYRLGVNARALGQLAAKQIDLVNHARPFLYELKQQSQETCFFSVYQDGATYSLDCVESDLPVRVVQTDKSRPLCCTAAGRVLLAFMDKQKQQDQFSGFKNSGFVDRIITDREMLQTDMQRVVRQGYAIDDQELDDGVAEIAAPVFDENCAIAGTLSISGPKNRLTAARIERELLPLLCEAASHLSALLGCGQSREALCGISLQPVKAELKVAKAEIKPKQYAYNGLKAYC